VPEQLLTRGSCGGTPAPFAFNALGGGAEDLRGTATEMECD
jgi:hypothetical protein